MLENVEQGGVHHPIVVQAQCLAGPGFPYGWWHISRRLDPLAGVPQTLAAPPTAEYLTEYLQTVLTTHLLLRRRTLTRGGHQGVGAQVTWSSLRSRTGEGLQFATMTLDGVIVGGPVDVLDQAAGQRAGYNVSRSSHPLLCTPQLIRRRFIEARTKIQVVRST